MTRTQLLVADAMAAGFSTLSRKEAEALAVRYGVCSRTVRRWIKKGVNVRSPRSVASYLAEQSRPSPRAISKILSILEIKP
jgi:hypothetical protein